MLLWATDVSGSEYDAVFARLKEIGFDGVEPSRLLRAAPGARRLGRLRGRQCAFAPSPPAQES